MLDKRSCQKVQLTCNQMCKNLVQIHAQQKHKYADELMCLTSQEFYKNYVEVAVLEILGNECEVLLSELVSLSVVTDLVVS